MYIIDVGSKRYEIERLLFNFVGISLVLSHGIKECDTVSVPYRSLPHGLCTTHFLTADRRLYALYFVPKG